MTSLAYQRTYELTRNASPSGTLLVQLAGTHDQLVREMERLDQLTLGPLPAATELTTARWRLSQASLGRRTLSTRIIDFLSNRLDNGVERLKTLREADQALMRRSAQHVGKWTADSIRRDWSGYCTASREIRLHMRAHVQAERQLLYPMLEQLAARGK